MGALVGARCAASRYQMSEKSEYFAIRNAAGLFDSSPLFKYRIHGPGRRALPGRRPRSRHPDLRSRARPVHGLVRRPRLRGRGRRGPPARHPTSSSSRPPSPTSPTSRTSSAGSTSPSRRSRDDCGGPGRPGSAVARHPGAARPRSSPRSRTSASPTHTIAGIPIRVSRTGYTGDLGYELWIPSARRARGLGRGLGRQPRPGRRAVRADRAVHGSASRPGCVLLDVDFHSSRFAWTDEDRTTLDRAGPRLDGPEPRRSDDRAFIGRDAIRRELADRTSRWKLTGLVVDWRDYDRIYDRAGLIPPKDHTPIQDEYYIYDDDAEPARLRHEPDVLADAPAPHRPRPRAARSGVAGLAGQAGARRSTTATSTSTRPSPDCRCSTPSEGPPDMPKHPTKTDPRTAAKATSSRSRPRAPKRRPDLRRDRHRRRPQRPDQRRVPRQGRPARRSILERRHLVGGAAITEELRPGFWFTTFSYALSLLRPDIVQDLELVKHGFMPILMPSTFAPDGERRLPAGSARTTARTSRRSRATARTTPTRTTPFNHDVEHGPARRIKPLLDAAPPDLFSDDPEELLALAEPRQPVQAARQEGAARRRPAADRQRRGLPRRLLRVGHPQGLPGLVGDHRDQGRAVFAGLRARAALPLARRARRRVRGVGVPQAAATAGSPRCWPGPPSRSARRSGSSRRSSA